MMQNAKISKHCLRSWVGAPVGSIEERPSPRSCVPSSIPPVACVSATAASEAVAALVAAGIEPSDFSMGSPSLDEVFLALTGKGAEA
jgi:hypothetical protein